MAGRAFRIKVQLDVHAVRVSLLVGYQTHNSVSYVIKLFTSKGYFFLSSRTGDVPRRLAVSQWQGGPANRRSRLLRGIPQNKPDLPAAVPRQVYV